MEITLRIGTATSSSLEERLKAFIPVLNGESHYGPSLVVTKDLRTQMVARIRPSLGGVLCDEEVALRDRLRSLVDAWIDSGIGDQQTECPRDRSLNGSFAQPSREPEILRNVANGVLSRHPPFLSALDNGSISLDMSVGLGVYGNLSRNPTVNHSKAEDEADRLFTFFILSEERFKIARCRRCGVYYFLSRPRAIYKRGSFCRKCKSAECAIKRTKETREREFSELITAAASACGEWEVLSDRVKRKHSDRKGYVAWKLQKRKFTVKRNWVTRHIEDIVSMRQQM
jgi:hypothetical protein